MRERQSAASILIVLAAVVLPAGTSQAQTTAPGPYYATPSWDQQLPGSTRFVVLSNWNDKAGDFTVPAVAVLDRETGLVWERMPAGPADLWALAQLQCNSLSKGNRRGWRLPTVQELMSLMDPSVPFHTLALPAGHPFENVQANFYWTANTSSINNNSAWAVLFDNDLPLLTWPKNSNRLVWCVRGGQGVDVQ